MMEEVAMAEEGDMALRHIPAKSQEFLGADPFAEISDQQLSETSIEATSQPLDHDPPPMLPSTLRFMPAPPSINATTPAAKSPIQRAVWNQPSKIRLINPASISIAQPEADALNQAIYYEATDQPSDTQQLR